MSIIQRSILIEENDLIKYLNENWKGFDTKDYELLAAVLLARLHAEKFKEVFHISLPVKTKISESLKNEYSYETIKEAMAFLDEDSPIDIALIPETSLGTWPTDNFRRPRVKSQAFQLKRIGANADGDRTEEVLKLLSTLHREYAPVQAGLVLVVGGSGRKGSMDLAEIGKRFSPTNFPFEAVFFLTWDDEQVTFGQILPNLGVSGYSRKELFKGISI